MEWLEVDLRLYMFMGMPSLSLNIGENIMSSLNIELMVGTIANSSNMVSSRH